MFYDSGNRNMTLASAIFSVHCSQIHRALMVVTALCTWIGFTLIAVQLGGLDFGHNHNIIGFVVFCKCERGMSGSYEAHF